MNRKTNKHNIEMVTYISRTFKNKICALALLICGIVSVYVVNDPTFMVFTLIGGVPLFLTRKRVIY